MSADNFVVITKKPDGYWWGMGFASVEQEGRYPDGFFANGPFSTYDVAHDDAYESLKIIEYGVSYQEPNYPASLRVGKKSDGMAERSVQALRTHREIERRRKENRTEMMALAVELGADQERFSGKGGNVVDFLDGYLVGIGQRQAWRKGA